MRTASIILAAVFVACKPPVADNLSTQLPPGHVLPPEPARNLDDPLLGRGDSAEIDMIPGRINKVPVSGFLRQPYTVAGQHRAVFRTADCADGADTGLIVTWTDATGSYTAFNNDAGVIGGCSSIDTGFHGSSVTYTIYAFSMIRGTSEATLQAGTERRAGQLLQWTTITRAHFGGTVVRVGALQEGDFIQVQTPDDGITQAGTRMLLFQPPPGKTGVVPKAAIFSDEESVADRDPRIAVDGSWPSTQNAVLLGKDDLREASRLADIEARVDLVRGPLEVVAPDRPFACDGSNCTGEGVVLPRGRYFASLFANTTQPVGHVTAGNEQCPGGGTGHCADEVGTDDEGDCPHIARGQGNDRAFIALLRRNGVVLERRLVPRGLLGANPAVDRNQIIFEVDADGSSAFSLHVEDRASDVTFFGGWRTVRNPDVNEMKVATWNFYYKAFRDNVPVRKAILANAVDLLATRGDIEVATRTIVEPRNQAPWQWDADVVAFQEFLGDTFLTVRDRLKERSPYVWDHVNANTEINDFWNNTFYGPVFVNELVRPADGIKYGAVQLNDGVTEGRCNSGDGVNFDFACPLGYSGGYMYNRAVPARLRARRSLGRNAGADRPVAFFNWHLFHEQEAFSARATNVDNMVKSIKYLMARPADPPGFAAGACAFNKECANDPMHHANRIIIVGDSNMKSHQCGEWAWTVRKLRQEFGYAVDVASAVVDPMNRTLDMHWSGASLTHQRSSEWGSCKKNSDSSKTPKGDGTLTGCPFQFQHRLTWNAEPEASKFTLQSWYPWWATTTINEDDPNIGGGRFDKVILVGRGWAYDDPVLTYRVMSHREERSPMNGMAGGGVEIGYDVATCQGPVLDNTDKHNYAPKVEVNGCGTHAGAPAIRSDHIPTGARLRVWGR